MTQEHIASPHHRACRWCGLLLYLALLPDPDDAGGRWIATLCGHCDRYTPPNLDPLPDTPDS